MTDDVGAFLMEMVSSADSGLMFNAADHGPTPPPWIFFRTGQTAQAHDPVVG